MAIQRTTDDDGSTLTFILTSENLDGPVSVVGSFNDWTPGVHPLEAGPDGSRSVSVAVAAGEDVYFRYLGPDGYWFDDPDADEITAEGSVLRARAHEVITEDHAEETPADPTTPLSPTEQAPEADAIHRPAPATQSSEPSTPDETGERLEAVAERIDLAKSAAHDLVDHNAFEPRSTEVADDHAPQPTS